MRIRVRALVRVAAVTVGISTAGLVMAQPALANSFTTSTQGGTARYDDGTDSFCVHASDSEGTRSVRAVLRPLNGVGPAPTAYDTNASTAQNCVSLAKAYEDTKYRATIYAYWGETGTTTTKVVDFWS